jgi:hypothetical protein
MMILHPSSLNPVAAYDEDEALRIGRASPINNPKVLTSLVRIMKADATENSLSTSKLATLRQKQAQILKILCYQTDMMGQEFIDYLQE